MLTDSYGIVLNSKATYIDIAEKLKNKRPVVINWTDELGTCLNILFAFGCYQQMEPVKNVLNGIHPALCAEDLLFVGIVDPILGSLYAFQVNNEVISQDYLTQKLGISFGLATEERFCNLVNNVKLCLYNMLKDPKAYDFDFSDIVKNEVEEENPDGQTRKTGIQEV